MKKLCFTTILLLMVCCSAFSQVNYSQQFRSYGNDIQQSLFETTTLDEPVVATLNMLSQVKTARFSLRQYNWSSIRREPDYSAVLYLNEKQDMNGRDLIQPAITNQMTDQLIRRNLPR